MHPEVQREVEAARADRTHGASWLARRALEVAGLAAELSAGPSAPDVAADVGDAARALVEARPGMAPVRNWLDRLLAEVAREAARVGGPEELRRAARALVGDMTARAEAAGHLAAGRAAEAMGTGERVFTASYSVTVAEACRLARQTGRLTEVLAAESRSPAGIAYGEQMARELARSGVPAAVVPDADLARAVGRASLALVGADSVLRDGSVLNGTPTLVLARAARAAGLRVWVVCEAAKVDRWTDPVAVRPEPGFDRVPAGLVDAIITDEGRL